MPIPNELARSFNSRIEEPFHAQAKSDENSERPSSRDVEADETSSRHITSAGRKPRARDSDCFFGEMIGLELVLAGKIVADRTQPISEKTQYKRKDHQRRGKRLGQRKRPKQTLRKPATLQK